ncbi:MAG TPA: hypothetical protein VGU23_03180 [Acidobacteriaceae bacterium]|nr:hypothetical protein [Acidobacteriaceae bacterium]
MRCIPTCVLGMAGLAGLCSIHASLAQTPLIASADADAASSSYPDAPGLNLPRTLTSITVTADHAPIPQAIIRAEADREIKIEETQRIAAVVPNFYDVIQGEGVPLDKMQKTQLAWRATIDPFNVVGAFVLGGASEIAATHRGFGWGPVGYGKRVGANLADVVDGTMLSGAVYPILLHQDPRYFRQGSGRFSSRLRHAFLATIVCRGDNGRTQPNLSNVFGNLTAGAISNTYYPDRNRGFSLTLLNAGIVTLEGTLGTVAMEFAPDVQARLQHRNRASLSPSDVH